MSPWIDRLRLNREELVTADLFAFRRIGFVAPWMQILLVAGLFTATTLFAYSEYRAHGTVAGYAGPGFNALVAPIYEELVFRGWILGRLARRERPWSAILVSSLLFGLVHLRLVFWLEPPMLARTMIYAGLVLGPLFGYLTLRFRCLWPAVVLHYLNNLMRYL